MEAIKRKYRKKNLQRTIVGAEIYEDFVNLLLEDNPDYFAIKTGYWDKTRTVFSLKKDTIQSLREEEKYLFNEVLDKAFKNNKGSYETKKLTAKLDEVTCKISDFKSGKKLYYKIIDFTTWKQGMQAMNILNQDKIIKGQKYRVKGVGYIDIVRVERSESSYLNPKYKHQEEDDYILMRLNKVCIFKNKSVYFARPLYGDAGVSFKYRIFEALKKHPELKASYPYISRKSLSDLTAKSKEKRSKLVKVNGGI